MLRRLRRSVLLALAALTAIATAGTAQVTRPTVPTTPKPAPRKSAPRVVPPRVACDGDTITAIEVRSHAPTATGLVRQARALTERALRTPHEVTRPEIITAYMRLAVGSICTERNRGESERLLRAQPFIASAAVRGIRDSPGHVHLVVDVTDELRPIAGAGVSHGQVSALLLGTQDFQGTGLSLQAHAERGFAYRNGFGMQAVQYGLLGRPAFVAVEAARRPVGGEVGRVELTEPYLTDLQQRAFHASASVVSGYTDLVRPAGEAMSLFVRRTTYNIAWVTRLRRLSGRGAVALVGVALLGEDVRTAPDLSIIADTGIVAGPPSPFSFPAYATTRIAAIGGVRALRFVTVQGFDALSAEQDMGVGVQFNLLAGSSKFTPKHTDDVFFASDLYAGAGGPGSFVVARVLAEGRLVNQTHQWDGVVMSGRVGWYGNASGERLHMASVEMAGLQHLVFPAQLTFGDAEGGLAGYSGASDVGAQRMVMRLEERRLLHTFGSHADAAVGVFLTAGKLWAGDAPYGRSTPLLASAGLSLFGAYPSGGKRTYRVDLAFPLNADRGNSHIELRFSATDRTRMLWREPSDVAHARSGAVPVSLMRW